MVLLFNTLNIAIIAENRKLRKQKKSAQKLFGHPHPRNEGGGGCF